MRGLVLFGLGVLAMGGAAFAQDATLPVGVGGGVGPACPTKAAATGETGVHVGPGDAYEVYDHLKAGQVTFVCDKVKGYLGIVYGKADCGVGKAIEKREPYMGGCNTGWVPAKALTATAE